MATASSTSGAVFFGKIGCHDPPWLPILSKSHEVFVTHSRPFCDDGHPLRSWPSSASFPLQLTLQQQPVDVVTSDHVTKVGNCSSASVMTSSFVFFSLQDIFIIFRYAHISNDCNFVIFLVVIVHVSHPYKSVDHTYAFIIRFLVFILMCRAVIDFNIELNAPLAISILFKISSSHFPILMLLFVPNMYICQFV